MEIPNNNQSEICVLLYINIYSVTIVCCLALVVWSHNLI